MRNFLRKLIHGRYGPDHLGVALVILSFIPMILYVILRYQPLIYLTYFIFATVLLRMLSYNIRRRQAENDKFIRYWWPIRTKIVKMFRRIKKFFKKK